MKKIGSEITFKRRMLILTIHNKFINNDLKEASKVK